MVLRLATPTISSWPQTAVTKGPPARVCWGAGPWRFNQRRTSKTDSMTLRKAPGFPALGAVTREETMDEDTVVALMESSTSAQEWDANCDKVKEACGGYPDFWWAAIKLSGLASRTLAKFGESAEIKITPLKL